jgi:hypothetical protein
VSKLRAYGPQARESHPVIDAGSGLDSQSTESRASTLLLFFRRPPNASISNDSHLHIHSTFLESALSLYPLPSASGKRPSPCHEPSRRQTPDQLRFVYENGREYYYSQMKEEREMKRLRTSTTRKGQLRDVRHGGRLQVPRMRREQSRRRRHTTVSNSSDPTKQAPV